MGMVRCFSCSAQLDTNDCTRTFANGRWYFFCRECERNGARLKALAAVTNDPSSYIAYLEGRIDGLEERLSQFESKTGFMNAETLYANAKEWIARNPRAWAFIKQRASKCFWENHRFSMKRTLEELRDSDLVNPTNEDDFKISNSYSSVLARFLILEMPEIAELTTLKKSKVDRFFK